MLMLICFLAAGCERSGTLTPVSNNKKSSILSPAQKNNTTSVNVNNADGSTNTTSSTNKEMQEASNMLDKLDSSLNGLDNSSDINTTESIINNIN